MNQPPRILHVISRLDGYGAARMLRYLAAHQLDAGRSVAIAALEAVSEIADPLRSAGAAIHNLGRRWRFDPIALGRLAWLRRRSPFDVVHAWDADARIWARLSGRGRPLAAQIPPGVPAAGPSTRPRAAVLAELGLPPEARLVALAGPLVRRKQVDEAIWCYELVRVVQEQSRLVILGDGPDRLRLERYAGLVSDPECVRFAGYRADLCELLPHVDVFWQLDASASTPYALLEAMAAGLAIVASDVQAHRAAIEPGVTGFLTPLDGRAAVARATDDLLADEALARAMGAAARAAATASWSLDARLAAYDALYRLCNSPRPAAK
jgi:glycosyltransferase involved in cell wall biosynthesis